MKTLFKKYYHSTLRPGEFRKIADFFCDKKNTPVIYKEMKPLWDTNLQQSADLPKPDPAVMQKIKEAIWLNDTKAAQRKIKIYSLSLRIAAVLVIGLLVSTVFFFQRASQNQPTAYLQTVSTPPGAKTSTVLPDGSMVWLNSGSEISFPSQFDKQRPIALTGEAFFEVVKGDKPFIVKTEYGEVEVLGTSFNVMAYADDGAFETTLVEGKVSLNSKNTSHKGILKPGQHAVLGKNGFTINNVDTQYFTSWKEGRLIFSREPFPSFIKKLERWYNTTIEYNDPELDELWYTGTIEMESLSEVMEMISKSAPVTCNYDNKTRVFTIQTK